MIKVTSKFNDVGVLFAELPTLIAHYKNEGIYGGHKIIAGPSGYTVSFDVG